MKLILLFVFILAGAGTLTPQTRAIDSLRNVLLHSAEDTGKVHVLNDLSWELAHNGQSLEAIEKATAAKELSEKIGYKKGVGSAYSNLGIVYYSQSNYARALDYHLKSLKTMESIGNRSGMGVSYNNIGNIYSDMHNYDKAVEYYMKDLEICRALKDSNGMSVSYSNIGILYNEWKNYEQALAFHRLSLHIKQRLNDQEGIGMTYLNMSVVYEDLKQYDTALAYSFKALALLKEYGGKADVGIVYINLGSVYNKTKEYRLAIQYSRLGLDISKEVDEIDNMRLCYENLATACAANGNYDDAYNYHVLFKKLTDSIFNVENSRQLNEVNTNYAVEKKEAELNARAELEKERLETIAKEEDKRQLILMVAVLSILLVVVVFSVFLYKRFRVSSRQKDIIEIQKHLVDEKQKEIIDSINYAKRIQQAILPAATSIKEHLPESFIFYKPKDIVAGDFFWFEYLADTDTVFIAAADCTGHGVPGAMVSVVCSNAINRAVNEFRITDPGMILDKTREIVIETFERSGETVNDGMDISLAAIQIGGTHPVCHWSGANNPLWYFSRGELHIVKGDKQPIGKSDHTQRFTTHHIELDRGDRLYLFTDGFADQFGGPKGKKFKYKQLQQLITACVHLQPAEQLQTLSDAFNSWKGDLEQADDVTMIGIII